MSLPLSVSTPVAALYDLLMFVPVTSASSDSSPAFWMLLMVTVMPLRLVLMPLLPAVTVARVLLVMLTGVFSKYDAE